MLSNQEQYVSQQYCGANFTKKLCLVTYIFEHIFVIFLKGKHIDDGNRPCLQNCRESTKEGFL